MEVPGKNIQLAEAMSWVPPGAESKERKNLAHFFFPPQVAHNGRFPTWIGKKMDSQIDTEFFDILFLKIKIFLGCPDEAGESQPYNIIWVSLENKNNISNS